MQPSPKSKDLSRAAAGLGRSIKRRNNCVVGSVSGINFFTHQIKKFCDTSPTTKRFCFDSEEKTGGQASCVTRPAGFEPAGIHQARCLSAETACRLSSKPLVCPSIALCLILLLYMRRAHQRFHRPHLNAEACVGLVWRGPARCGLYHHSDCLAPA